MSVASRVTPMLQQYFEAKARAGDALLLYRMGDFYELFFEDARTASALLGLTLTSRHRDSDIEAPMCGMPHHAVEGYIAQLIAAGHRVAVCDQVEDAKKAKGLVRREITRIVTPGTVLEPESLPGARPNYLAALCRRGKRAGVAFLDLSTGELRAGEVADEELADVMTAYPAREILLPEGSEADGWAGRATARPAAAFAQATAEKRLAETFRAASLEAFGFAPGDAGLAACWAALEYARENRRGDALHISPPRPLAPDRHLRLDAATLAHLEIFESADPRSGATLFSALDETATPMGSRALREMLARPLRGNLEIEARLDGVEELVSRAGLRAELRERLSGVGDLARRVGRIALRAAGPRDVAGLGSTLRAMPELRESLRPLASPPLAVLRDRFPDTEDVAGRIARTLVEEPPALISAGGAVRDEADPELAELRGLRSNAQEALTRFEARERERTGIANLRVRYNRVFGYSIEITRGQKEKTPADYVRRQTLANAERFTTPELSELEAKILGADERILEIEARVFGELAEFLAAESTRLAEVARALGEIDLYASLAETAATRGYVRPRIAERPGIRIVEGRHPVVERVRRDEPFVANDVALDAETRIVILTGPNMGGKSTFLRQIALIALLARAGAFVPAREAEIGPIDRIFTRVGASDHLARGESTFMVEMIEAANILRNATPESLVILDEVGRGTSTFDGLSLAWAIVEHLR
ncbi:MAG TPA: DNA mismatch repair protein MutS, partial [Thermoanaerobaculia bacterium]|nr:DNA mismatch repair protein MutS [Thermoanaerobaculia bacterium]